MGIRLSEKEGLALARHALDMMADRGIPPTAPNYEVWITHVLGENSDLSMEIAEIESQNTGFTEAVCARLHDTYFGQRKLGDELMRTGSDMTKELEEIQERLAEAGRNTADYGRTLKGASDSMGGEADAERMKSLVQTLMGATSKMRRHTETLECKLRDTSHEILRLRTNLEHVREQAMTDALTGIANRKRLEEMLAKAVAEAGDEPLSLAIVDIDHFKRFNDTWGHQTGDQIIRFVAQCLSKTVQGFGEIGRYGGEEFVAVLPGVDLVDAKGLAESARATVESKRLFRRSTNEDLGEVTISAGVAQLRKGEDGYKLLSRADVLLYRSKAEGRNRVTAEDTPPADKAHAA